MITIYSKPNCGFCVRAEQLCKSKHLPYQLLKLDQDFTKEELQAKCPSPVRSVPQIFDDGVYIGGYTEFAQHVEKTKAL